jgi:hypothetical protein
MEGSTMNNRVFRTIAASLASLSTQLLKVAGERAGAVNEFPIHASRDSRTSRDSRNLEPAKASTRLRSVRRWPQSLGPFMIMILTLRRQTPAAERGRLEKAALPEGALFVVRYGSR